MTTATDWDVRDRDTSDRLTVTDVQARIDQLDGAATEAPVQIEPWIPRDPHAGERCRCGEYHESALIAPTSSVLAVEGSTVAAEMVSGIDHRPGWPTWLGAVHHADATWTQAVTDLRSWADSYTARDVEHTTAERVEISDEYAEKRLAAELQYRGLTAQADTVGGQRYDEEHGWVEIDAPPDNRVDRMVEDPERYFAEARERAERQVQAESGADLVAGPPHRLPPPPPPPAETAQRAGVLAPLAQQPAQEVDDGKHASPLWRGSILGNWLRRRKEPVIAAGIVVLWAAAMVALVVLA